MTPGTYRPIGPLERLRRTGGTGMLKNRFAGMLRRRKSDAVRMLNDEGLSFGTLYALRPEIEKAGIAGELSEKNRAALEICGKIAQDPKLLASGGIDYGDQTVHSAFLWMFQTGARDDGLGEAYDEALDLCASVLLRRYRETAILPELVDLIFRRNRKRGYLHDLIWAFFESRDPGALRYIAKYLRSENARDTELACLLLHLPRAGSSMREKANLYRSYLNWLDENKPFLYFTGESLQSSNQPEICGVDLGAKYLCKNISPRSRRPADPLTQQEQESLSCFARTKEPDRAILSSYSRRLHDKDPARWEQWIHSPVEKQIETAKGETGRRAL